jgi:uncharacterized protein
MKILRISLLLPAALLIVAHAMIPPKPVVKDAVAAKAEPFGLHQVRLLDGPFKEGQDIAVKYLLRLEPDRFLANFRKEAGLPPKAEHYGGWESQGVSGHTGGHYLSACALAHASTGDKRFLDRVNHITAELAECQKAHGDGYLAAIPGGRRIYQEIAAGDIRSGGFDLNGGWVPNYTMHKLFAGLRDAYRLCGNVQALEVSRKLADWFEKTHAGLSEQQMQDIMVAEFGGLNETFADLYSDTGDERYLKLARRFHHKAIIDPLARREEILPGKHANTQIPKLIGSARTYEITGEPADHVAAEFFWDRVVNHHSYITGGHCDHEHFGIPGKLNDRLSNDTTETCNVYNMLKLSRHLFSWKPRGEVADFHERALLNHMRGTQHPDGRVIYNLTLRPGAPKHYQTLFESFTCCVASGLENHVRYGEGIYFHHDDELWVNLFIASELDWKERGVRLRQETRWPYGDASTFVIQTEEPQQFTLRLRHPHWALDGLRVSINGEEIQTNSSPSGYLEIRRNWKSGDRVELKYPMSLRSESMPDNPKRIGVFYGPTLLAGDLGPAIDPAASMADYVPSLVTDGRPPADWVKAVSLADLRFRTDGVGKPRDVDLVPFFAIHDRRQTVFFDVFTATEWAAREAEILAARQREAELAARTVDLLRIGEQQPEKDHNLQGEKTRTGEGQGRKWRDAVDGGWFSFELAVAPGQPNDLQCTYWGGESDERVFDILVDGTVIATQTLHQDKPGEFFDVVHAIPQDLTRGKNKVTIRFQAHPGKLAGGLFGVRIIRK